MVVRIVSWSLAGALIFTSGLMMWDSYRMANPAPLPSRHDVSKEQESIAEKWVGKNLPPVVKQASGKLFENWLSKGPVFLYFIKEGCPCSKDLEKWLKALEIAHGDTKVQFVGVINVDAKGAEAWKQANHIEVPILADPQQIIIGAFEAKRSAESCLILPDGSVKKRWPGYSRAILTEINQALAQFSGASSAFSPSDAPENKTAGCSFSDPN